MIDEAIPFTVGAMRLSEVDRRNRQEELLNTFTHGFGLLLGLFGFFFLVVAASRHGGAMEVAACSIYGVSLLILYGASTCYHWLRSARNKALARVFDHCAIYVLIAGTYTPFALIFLRGGLGWLVFAAIWMLAFCGIVFKALSSRLSSRLSTVSYVLMGWLAVFLVVPLYQLLPLRGFVLLLAGGVAYTSGVYFFIRTDRRFHHAIWHLFVLGGSLLHYLAIMFSVQAL